MQTTAIVRLIDGRLAWYSPGASEEPRWLDDTANTDALRSALAQRRLEACFAVPGVDARLLEMPVTASEKKHFAKSLPFALEEQVAADIEDLHFAYCALDNDTMGVALCSVDRMAEWQAVLADLPGIRQWLPEPLLLPFNAGEWCLVLEGDSAIVRFGRCDGCTVEQVMLAPLLQGLLLEREAPKSVIVYGADQAADIALLPESLQDAAQWRQGNLYSAMLLSDTGSNKLNLLQGAFAARLPLQRWWRQWRAVAAVFVAAFVLQLAASYADYRNLAAQNLSLRTAVQDSYRKAFPRGQVVDAEKQLRRQLDGLRGTSSGGGFVSLMDRVGGAVAGMPGTSIATINYNEKSDEMRLNVVASDFEAVEQLRSRINDAGLTAVMESSNAQNDKVRARLRVEES